MEIPLYFNNFNGRRLFGVVFDPNLRKSDTGIIICQPVGEERHRTKRLLVNLSRYLSSNGYLSFIFDYFGEGDSEGNFQESDIKSKTNDICSAAKFLIESFQIKQIGLLGVSIGANLALNATKYDEKIIYSILWNPVENGKDYFYNLLRINLATQMTIYGKIISNRKKLIEILEKNDQIEIEGYIINKKFYKQLIDINLFNDMWEIKIKILFFEIINSVTSKSKKIIEELNTILKSKMNVEHYKIQEKIDLKSMRNYTPKIEGLYSETLSWILENEK